MSICIIRTDAEKCINRLASRAAKYLTTRASITAPQIAAKSDLDNWRDVDLTAVLAGYLADDESEIIQVTLLHGEIDILAGLGVIAKDPSVARALLAKSILDRQDKKMGYE